jgi:hypothetical protein
MASDEASREALRQKGEAYLEAALSSGGATTVPPSVVLATAAPRGSRRSTLQDPDILAVGSFLEHARLGGVLLLFGVCTSAQTVLLRAALFHCPRAYTLVTAAQLLPTAWLVAAAGRHGLLVAPDTALSVARARAALPDAVGHCLLTLASLAVVSTGGVDVFVAMTAACVPPLVLYVEGAATGRLPGQVPSKKARAAAYGSALATALVLLRGSAALLLAVATFLCVLAADRAYDTMRRAPRVFGGPADDVEGGGHEKGGAAAEDAVTAMTLRVQQLNDSVAGASRAGNAAPALPPSPYERVLYGNALPVPLLLLLALLRGEMVGLEWSLISLGAVLGSAGATAGASLAVLLLAETQLLPGPVQARATAVCNAAAVVLNLTVGVPPRPGLLATLLALGAVAAGAAFRLAQ